MKKTLTATAILSVLALPAFARTTNVENPLFLPQAGKSVVQIGYALMTRTTNDSQAFKDLGIENSLEFPIYRLHYGQQYGITDRLAFRTRISYTANETTGRQGLNDGTIGLAYRVFDGSATNGWVLDLNADFVLAGLFRMNATVVPSVPGAEQDLSFRYDNYSNGRFGQWFGAQLGKTWGRFTGAGFAEVQYTMASHNSRITLANGLGNRLLTGTPLQPFVGQFEAGLPDHFSASTASTWEGHAGFRGFYQANDQWSFNGGVAWRQRAANTVTGIHLDYDSTMMDAFMPGAMSNVIDRMKEGFMGNLHDGWHEYIFSGSINYQINDRRQVVLYTEYTVDSAEARSQGGTTFKMEFGVRLNALF